MLYEVDLLHEIASPLEEIPIYPHEPGSHPYYIAATDPRLTPIETWVKGFDVDEPFPLINIPLVGEDIVRDFSLGEAYNETVDLRRLWKFVDYPADPDPERQRMVEEKLNRDVPPAIETYSPADQERIHAKIQEVVVMAGQEK